MIDPTLEESQRLNSAANRLFSGFTKKLAAMRSEALDLYERIQANDGPTKMGTSRDNHRIKLVNHYQTIHRRFQSLEPALSKFARQISQRLDHTDIDEIVRIELEARLADFESEIRTTREYLTDYIP